MRLVNGLSEAGARRVEAARRQAPFTSVQDVTERAALNRHDLEALAAADALVGLTGNRHLAFWEVAATEKPLPIAPPPRGADSTPLLPVPTEGQNLVADYRAVGLTLNRHPMALLRDLLKEKQVLSARELDGVRNGAPVRTAGIVVTRQRPGSASGVTFVTIEDETGSTNLIVWKAVGERYRNALVQSKMLEVAGKLQREGLVMHVIAERLVDRSGLLGALVTEVRDFH